MKTVFFDCPFGAAGDMLLGALIDSGLSFEQWKSEMQKIALPANSFELRFEKLLRGGVHSTKMHVFLSTDDAHHFDHAHNLAHPHSHEPQQSDEHGHSHDDIHSHDDGHLHGHTHEHAHGLEHNHEHGHRGLTEILRIIENSKIRPRAKEIASAIFTRLGVAEAKVHGVTPDDVHFHEVGAVDAIVDILGFAVGYDLLGIEQAWVSPLPVGSGTVRSMHGNFPVPGPATLELLRESRAPIAQTNITFECLTPTGAAILTTIAAGFGSQPQMSAVDSIGYGAGSMNPSGHPNIVRLIIGESAKSFNSAVSEHVTRYRSEFVAVVEANFDDLSPQVISYASEKLLAEGALDVYTTACTMKKGRSGHLLTFMCKTEDQKRLKELLISETSTLGVRSYVTERLVAERELQDVSLDDDLSVRVKIGKDLQGNVVNVQPEFEDCATYARVTGTPLKEVLSTASTKAKKQSK
ncbi:MAG: nickel pincer cofactor biosynthesis protein LarC [Leptolyngbya sp.]|nr:nickel pincer cofactor biosynthesis protein LarC [Candidatus Melainabacteria bacterium]